MAKHMLRFPIRVEQLEKRNLLTIIGLPLGDQLAIEPPPNPTDEMVRLVSDVAEDELIIHDSLPAIVSPTPELSLPLETDQPASHSTESGLPPVSAMSVPLVSEVEAALPELPITMLQPVNSDNQLPDVPTASLPVVNDFETFVPEPPVAAIPQLDVVETPTESLTNSLESLASDGALNEVQTAATQLQTDPILNEVTTLLVTEMPVEPLVNEVTALLVTETPVEPLVNEVTALLVTETPVEPLVNEVTTLLATESPIEPLLNEVTTLLVTESPVEPLLNEVTTLLVTESPVAPILTDLGALLTDVTPPVELDVDVQIIDIVDVNLDLNVDLGDRLDVNVDADVETGVVNVDTEVAFIAPLSDLASDSGLQLEVGASVESPVIDSVADGLIGPIHAKLDIAAVEESLIDIDTTVDIGIEIPVVNLEIEIPSSEIALPDVVPSLPDLGIQPPIPDLSMPPEIHLESETGEGIETGFVMETESPNGNQPASPNESSAETESDNMVGFSAPSERSQFTDRSVNRGVHSAVGDNNQSAASASLAAADGESSAKRLDFFLVSQDAGRFVAASDFENAVARRQRVESENRRESDDAVDRLDRLFALEELNLFGDDDLESNPVDKVRSVVDFSTVEYLPETAEADSDEFLTGQEFFAALIAVAPVGLAAAMRAFEEFLENIQKAQQQLLSWLARFGALPWILMGLAVLASLSRIIRWRKECLKRRIRNSVDWAMV